MVNTAAREVHLALTENEIRFLAESVQDLMDQMGDRFDLNGMNASQAEVVADAYSDAAYYAMPEERRPSVASIEPPPLPDEGTAIVWIEPGQGAWSLCTTVDAFRLMVACLELSLPLYVPWTVHPGRGNGEAYRFLESLKTWARSHGIKVDDMKPRPGIDPLTGREF